MKNLFKNLQNTILFLVPALIFSQNIEIRNLDNRGTLNLLNLHLAATKLCKDYYSETDLSEERKNKTSYKIEPESYSRYGCHVCVESLRFPFMNPLESFVHHFLKDKRIQTNKNNVFKLRTIRKDIEDKYRAEYNTMVDSIDTENIVYYQNDVITGYALETNELVISMHNPQLKGLPNAKGKLIFYPELKGHGINDKGQLVNYISNMLAYFKIPMEEAKAEEIYNAYADHYHPNPPFRISTKLHYALRLSEDIKGSPRYYQVIFKRVEFFLPGIENLKKTTYKVLDAAYKPENKIAEVIFDETVHYTEEGYAFQNIISKE